MQYNITLLGQVLRDARKAKGITQAALAEKSNVALRTIAAVEKGKRYPKLEIFYKIIRALDISADQIFWPEKMIYTGEQVQVIREFLECSEWEQDIIVKTMRVLVRSIRGNGKEQE